MNFVKGFKVFNPDWTCNPTGKHPYKYEVGKVYTIKAEPLLCERGFHFCINLAECFHHYDFSEKNKVAEVLAFGDIVYGIDKCCTNKIKIVRELSWEEVLKYANIGAENVGFGNIGDDNKGKYNTGSNNTGNFNTGDCNKGHSNTGHFNEGNCNTGGSNKGDFNTGEGNNGDYNSGDYNKGDHLSGCFNNISKPKIMMFNKPSPWTFEDWMASDARYIMSFMGNDRQLWWNCLRDEDKEQLFKMPNFDRKIFADVLGIEIEEEVEDFDDLNS